MKRRLIGLFIASCFLPALSCTRPARETGALDIRLVSSPSERSTVLQVTGLSSGELAALDDAGLSEDRWQNVLRIAVSGSDSLAVAGRYVVTESALEFHPRFPFDRGQPYTIRFDPSKLPTPRGEAAIERTVSLPAPDLKPSSVVTAIYPTAGVWPENLLRFYVHFSAPMSRTDAIRFISLLDEKGHKLSDVFLEVNANLWNSDDTRFTVLFDPGRVKRGILPNIKIGRAIRDRGRYTIVVDPAWRDAAGRPLKEEFRREVRIGLAEERALSPAAWHLAPPDAGTREPLVVTFPWPLDHGLLQRAIGVSFSDGRAVAGTIATGADETRWNFMPEVPWVRGNYRLVVLTLLEDPSGNKVGRAFEVQAGETAAAASDPETIFLPFTI